MYSEYKEYHTDITVRFVLKFLSEDKVRDLQQGGLHKALKLYTSLSNTTMVLFDSKGVHLPADLLLSHSSPFHLLSALKTDGVL